MYSVFHFSDVKRYVRSKEFRKIPKEVFHNLKMCVQRIKNGFCSRDIWSINVWFLNVIPDMLEELAHTTHSYPRRFLKSDGFDMEENDKAFARRKSVGFDTEEENKAFAKWKGILTEMAFLFREANPSTCRKKNPYQEEHDAAFNEFFKRFGFGGKWVKKKDGTRVFIRGLRDIPKYRDLDENYCKSERELCEYRANCQKKAFAMFVEYFDDLWD